MTLRPEQYQERLSTARHEAGHALAAWWNGQSVYAMEMRTAEEGGGREDRRGRVVDAGTLAYVEATTFIAAPALAADHLEVMANTPPDLLRDMVARDLLYTLAGPAADWRNQRDPEEVCACLSHHLDEWLGGCARDLEQAGYLLALLPEEEREEARTAACLRASSLVCRYWPELCALAEHLRTPERLEDEALDVVLSSTLGDTPELMGNDLGELDPSRLALGSAEVVAWWERSEGDPDEWRLAASADRVPLSPGIAVAYLSPDEMDSLCAEEMIHPSGWYPLANDSLDYTRAFPAMGKLRQFLISMVDAKLDEMRRDPDYLAMPEESETAQ